MIRLVFIRSGSKGNATLVDSGSTLILIDMGVSLRNLKEGLSLIGKTLEDLDAALFTHNHSDHIRNAHMAKRYCPLYASEETLQNPDFLLEPGVGVDIGDFVVIPFAVSHDAPNPVNFLILQGDERYVHITDTGLLDESYGPLLCDADYYLMESNHDVEMELTSRRPLYMIRRIMGDCGHLSNDDSAAILSSLIGPRTKGVYLGHLSDDCNTHEAALETHRKVYDEAGIDYSHIDLRCTSQCEIVIGGDTLS